MLLTLIYKGSTRRCGPLNRHNAMELTLADFEYLGMCMEGFLFGTLSVLQMPRPLTKSLTLHCLRTLFWNIRHVFIILWIEGYQQDEKYTLLCTLSPICFICCHPVP